MAISRSYWENLVKSIHNCIYLDEELQKLYERHVDKSLIQVPVMRDFELRFVQN